MKNTAVTFLEMKQRGEKISMLTCYDYSTAKLMEAAGINAVLVGDSLGNTMLGYPDTLSVTMEDMITYGAAVSRGCSDTLVVLDMPFMSYQASVEQAMINAGRLMKEGRGGAVKLEGGASVCPQIKAMTEAGIPVMAHLGMTPQSVNTMGGNKVQGKTKEAAEKLLEDAYAIQDAGAFSVVLECIPAPLGEFVSKAIRIPTIGIGGGNGCDGQILVYQDMLGMFTDFVPKFVKQFGNIGEQMTKAFKDYDAEVKATTFPDEETSFKMSDPNLLKDLKGKLRPEQAVDGEVDPEYLAKLY